MNETFTCPECARSIATTDLTDTFGSRLSMFCAGPRATPHREIRMTEVPAIDPSLTNTSAIV